MVKIQAQRLEGESWDMWVGAPDTANGSAFTFLPGQICEFRMPLPPTIEEGIESGHLVVIEDSEGSSESSGSAPDE